MNFKKLCFLFIILIPLIFTIGRKTVSESKTFQQKKIERIKKKTQENLLFSLGCNSCHTFEGPSETIPLNARKKIKGPNLWIAGNKFQKKYLEAWLQKPTPIRGVLWGTIKKGAFQHPSLSSQKAKIISSLLQNYKDLQIKIGTVPKWKKIPRRMLRRARILFQKKTPCYSCHKVYIRKTVYRTPIQVGGESGPSFINAGKRLKADFIYFFLKNPKRYNPNGRMPVFGDKAFHVLTETDMVALSAYIMSFR